MESVAKRKALNMFMDACDATPVYNSNIDIDDPIGYEEAKRSLSPRCGASNSLLLSHPSPKNKQMTLRYPKSFVMRKHQHDQPASAVCSAQCLKLLKLLILSAPQGNMRNFGQCLLAPEAL